MTVLGAFLPDHDHAVLWADSAVFRWNNTATGRHARKLATNNLARTLGAGAGWSDLAQVGDDLVHRAKSFDGAVEQLPELLRREASKAIRVSRPDPASFASSTYLLTGYSEAAGRTLLCHLDAAAFFVPVVGVLELAPALELPPRPTCEADVLELAQLQMTELRRGVPEAGSGHLTVALLSPEGISLRTFRDFFVPTPEATADVLPLQLAEATE